MIEGIPAAAYVHIPFCENKCGYCDFVSYAGRRDRIDDYERAIRNEIERTRQAEVRTIPLSTVYFGGGTPSVLEPESLNRILMTLSSSFGIASDAEVTIEANPGTVTRESLVTIRAGGFNRISFGVQSFSDHLLHAIGRIHSGEEAKSAILAAQEAGFSNICCDLMTGLPGQTIEDATDSLQTLISLGVDHISVYALTLEEGTPFFAKYSKNEDALPSDEKEREMYHRVVSELANNGYHRYEISNFCKAGRESRHNTVYWNALPYYGFGCGAHAYLHGVRRGNTPDLDTYIQAMTTDAPDPDAAVSEREFISLREAAAEAMLLGFRMAEGIDAESFHERFGYRPEERFGKELEGLQEKGLVIFADGNYRLTDRGFDFANEVFRAFVGED